MKKMMLVLMMLAMGCGMAMAGSESQMAVIRHGEIFKVIYKSPDLSCVKVSIEDVTGTKVFTEELISVQGFIRPYNFAELPKGDYTIQVINGNDKKSEQVHFTDQPWTAHICTVSSDDHKIMVAIPHEGLNDFSVQILDQNDQLVYEENQKLNDSYAKVFNLKNLKPGATVNVVNHSSGEIKSYTLK